MILWSWVGLGLLCAADPLPAAVAGPPALHTLGPLLDPIAPQQVSAEEHRLLPALRSLGAMADMWFVEAVNLQEGAGGIALFDPERNSAHGLSWTQMQVRLGALSIVDPARPGLPLFDVPYDAWETLSLQALWTDLTGFTWDVAPRRDAPSCARVWLRGGGAVDGGAWVPPGLFDRDPAFATGAPRQRRALVQAWEGSAQGTYATAWGPVRLLVEEVAHTHRYLTLAPRDPAQRQTALLSSSLRLNDWDAHLTLGWQRRTRSAEGAQFRWPEALTRAVRGQAVVAQLEGRRAVGEEAQLHLALGGAWRQDLEQARGTAPVDLADSWMWTARPSFAEDLARWRVDGVAELLWESGLRAELHGGFASWQATPHLLDGRTQQTLAGQPVSETLWHGGTAHEWVGNLRGNVSLQPHWRLLALEIFAGLDFTLLGHDSMVALNSTAVAAGAALRVPMGGGFEGFAMARREPDSLTAQTASFLDPQRPWGIEQSAQTGQGLPTGGRFHDLDPGLRRPSHQLLAFGARSPLLGPFVVTLQAVGRWLLDRYTVQSTALDGTPVAARDAQVGEAYAVDPAAAATARYRLQNDPQVPFHLGVELNIATVETQRWFVNVGGAAYVTPGNAPFGSFADRNDPGIVDESSAGQNNQHNAFGRYDQDRSFHLKLMAGGEIYTGLWISVSARYRDGQPFTRLAVQPLPQGPVALMAFPRGHARHTFHMTWDVRVRYELPASLPRGAVVLDVLNFWGSGTEMLEDPTTGPQFRRSLEAVPGRALLGSLELAF